MEDWEDEEIFPRDVGFLGAEVASFVTPPSPQGLGKMWLLHADHLSQIIFYF